MGTGLVADLFERVLTHVYNGFIWAMNTEDADVSEKGKDRLSTFDEVLTDDRIEAMNSSGKDALNRKDWDIKKLRSVQRSLRDMVELVSVAGDLITMGRQLEFDISALEDRLEKLGLKQVSKSTALGIVTPDEILDAEDAINERSEDVARLQAKLSKAEQAEEKERAKDKDRRIEGRISRLQAEGDTIKSEVELQELKRSVQEERLKLLKSAQDTIRKQALEKARHDLKAYRFKKWRSAPAMRVADAIAGSKALLHALGHEGVAKLLLTIADEQDVKRIKLIFVKKADQVASEGIRAAASDIDELVKHDIAARAVAVAERYRARHDIDVIRAFKLKRIMLRHAHRDGDYVMRDLIRSTYASEGMTGMEYLSRLVRNGVLKQGRALKRIDAIIELAAALRQKAGELDIKVESSREIVLLIKASGLNLADMINDAAQQVRRIEEVVESEKTNIATLKEELEAKRVDESVVQGAEEILKADEKWLAFAQERVKSLEKIKEVVKESVKEQAMRDLAKIGRFGRAAKIKAIVEGISEDSVLIDVIGDTEVASILAELASGQPNTKAGKMIQRALIEKAAKLIRRRYMELRSVTVSMLDASDATDSEAREYRIQELGKLLDLSVKLTNVAGEKASEIDILTVDNGPMKLHAVVLDIVLLHDKLSVTLVDSLSDRVKSVEDIIEDAQLELNIAQEQIENARKRKDIIPDSMRERVQTAKDVLRGLERRLAVEKSLKDVVMRARDQFKRIFQDEIAKDIKGIGRIRRLLIRTGRSEEHARLAREYSRDTIAQRILGFAGVAEIMLAVANSQAEKGIGPKISEAFLAEAARQVKLGLDEMNGADKDGIKKILSMDVTDIAASERGLEKMSELAKALDGVVAATGKLKGKLDRVKTVDGKSLTESIR